MHPLSKTILLPPLDQLRQANPTPHHPHEQPHANRMQHPRPHLLRQQSREEWRHRTPRTPQRTHGGQTTELQLPRDQLTEHRHGQGVHGPEQQAHQTHRHGLAHHIRHQPDQQLEQQRAHREDDGAPPLPHEPVGRVREREPAERDAAPEARGDVPDPRGRGVPVVDQKRDDPAGDGDLGALVGEDEAGAQDGGAVGEGLFQLGSLAPGGVAVGGAERLVRRGRSVELVGAEGEEGEAEVDERDGEGDEVEG